MVWQTNGSWSLVITRSSTGVGVTVTGNGVTSDLNQLHYVKIIISTSLLFVKNNVTSSLSWTKFYSTLFTSIKVNTMTTDGINNCLSLRYYTWRTSNKHDFVFKVSLLKENQSDSGSRVVFWLCSGPERQRTGKVMVGPSLPMHVGIQGGKVANTHTTGGIKIEKYWKMHNSLNFYLISNNLVAVPRQRSLLSPANRCDK